MLEIIFVYYLDATKSKQATMYVEVEETASGRRKRAKGDLTKLVGTSCGPTGRSLIRSSVCYYEFFYNLFLLLIFSSYLYYQKKLYPMLLSIVLLLHVKVLLVVAVEDVRKLSINILF